MSKFWFIWPLILYIATLGHTTRGFPSFWNMKQLGVLLIPLDSMLMYVVRLLLEIIGTHLHFWQVGGQTHCESKVSCPITRIQHSESPQPEA